MAALTLDQITALLQQHVNKASEHLLSAGLSAENVLGVLDSWASISQLLTEYLNTEDIYVNHIGTEEITANNAFVKYMECVNGVFKSITSDIANFDYVNADQVNAQIGNFLELNVDNLFADYVKATDLVAGTITVQQLFGTAAKFFSLISEAVSADSVTAFKITSDHLTINDAFIKSAMIDSIVADKITSGTLDTSKLTIQSESGNLIIADETITIKHDTQVRVQLGKDANGDYNLIILDAEGNPMWNALGITADAIKSAIIVDDMVADNANISGAKLDIASVIRQINNDSTKINSTSIVVDSDNQTLNIWFKTMVDWKSDAAIELETHSTQIQLMQGKLETLLSDTSVVRLTEQVEQLTDNYSSIAQTVSGISSTVSQTTQTLQDLRTLNLNLLDGSRTMFNYGLVCVLADENAVPLYTELGDVLYML